VISDIIGQFFYISLLLFVVSFLYANDTYTVNVFYGLLYF